MIEPMDFDFVLHGIRFVADREKAAANLRRHPGISFEQAAEAFFDPFLKVVDATRNEESREAIIGMDGASRLLFVVHVVRETSCLRLISARKATRDERRIYEDG